MSKTNAELLKAVIEQKAAVLNEKRKQVIAIKEDLNKDAKAFLYENAKSIFELYPFVKNVTWFQYTPSFCDGDPCYFSSTHTYFSVNYGEDDYGDTDQEGRYYPEEVPLSQQKEAESLIGSFLRLFSEDQMEQMFGNHVRVQITEKGINKEDYDCGY